MSKPFSTLFKSLTEAAIITVAVAGAALVINMFHPNRIPVVASEEYETMVPCPIQKGHVIAVNPSELQKSQNRLLFVDAREIADFAEWHYPGALLLTYDFLDPIPETDLHNMAKKIALMGANQVIVYGDGGNPDTGKLLGIDISAAGINNVYFVKGGAASLKTAVAKRKRNGRIK